MRCRSRTAASSLTAGCDDRLVSDDSLWVWQELVDTRETTVAFPPGGSTPLTVGRPKWHAVRVEDGRAVCGTAQRRLLPMGYPWSDPVPDHIERCPDCLRMHPLDG